MKNLITPRSAHETDVMVERMLTPLGYTNEGQVRPIHVTAPLAGGAAVRLDLETHDFNGLEWINTGADAAYDIANPLYDGINMLPH